MMCSYHHEKIYNPRKSRIRIVKIEQFGLDYPTFCRQCKNAPCVAACQIPYAITQNSETGVVTISEEKCVKCGDCIDACPFGAIKYHPDKKTLMICNLCNGDPACVKYCRDKAINYLEDGDIAKMVEKRGIDDLSEIVKKVEMQTVEKALPTVFKRRTVTQPWASPADLGGE